MFRPGNIVGDVGGVYGTGPAAGAVGSAAGAVGSAVSTAIGVARPMVAGLGGAVGTGLSGLDALMEAAITPVMEGVVELSLINK